VSRTLLWLAIGLLGSGVALGVGSAAVFVASRGRRGGKKTTPLVGAAA